METRKVQLAGESTFTVSLPKEWARRQGFEPGSEVHLYPHIDGSLVLRKAPEHAEDDQERVLQIDGMGTGAIRGAIRALYIEGAESIRLTTDGRFQQEDRETVFDTERHIIGLSLVSENSEELVLKTMLAAEDASVVQSAIQLRFATLSMYREATDAFLNGAPDTTDRLHDRLREVDRLKLLISRHFKRSLTDLSEVDRLEVGRPALFEYHQTAQQLLTIALAAVRIGEAAGHFEPELQADHETELKALVGELEQLLESTSESHLEDGLQEPHYDLDATEALSRRFTSIEESLSEGPSSGNRAALGGFVHELRLIAACAGVIARVGFQSTTRPEVTEHESMSAGGSR